MTSTYRPDTIRTKTLRELSDEVGMKCCCGTRISKKNLAYYRNEHGELKPICRECVEDLKDHVDFIIPLKRSKRRRYKI